MRRELDPQQLATRLEALRSSYVPETLEEAHARLAREQPRDTMPFDQRVARRLAELRALCELARALHRDR